MIRRTVAAVILMCALGATPALASTISLGVTSPVNAGSSFNVVVQVNDVFGGRAPGDVVVAFGFDVTIGDPGLFQFVGATVGPLFAPLALGTPMVAGFALNPLGIGPADFSGGAHARHAAFQRASRRRIVDRCYVEQQRSEPGPRVPQFPGRRDLGVDRRAGGRVGP